MHRRRRNNRQRESNAIRSRSRTPQGSYTAGSASSAEQPENQLLSQRLDNYFWTLAEREVCKAKQVVLDHFGNETLNDNEQATLRKVAQFIERTDATEDYNQYLRPYDLVRQDHSESIKLSIRVVFALWLRRRQWLRSCNENEQSKRRLLKHEVDQILTTWRLEYESSEEQMSLIAKDLSRTDGRPSRERKRSRFAAHRNRLACSLQMTRMWLTSPYFDWNTLKDLVAMASQC